MKEFNKKYSNIIRAIKILTELTITRSVCSREGIRNTGHETSWADQTFRAVQL